ncbi:hypothetical protein PPYR_13988 [Photinus pyralis]|uniref:tRNA-specific adenosine deaminase 1 n=4 Tax=Photinus pyralis TaxID=7054 RepID=A0A5N4A3Z3_PHOPY|nr:tRNA-specific adenosine deaminase 1 [Photinus pyralis]KAB0792027.1 hypothetical protein PPYR_13988 [Photinus pyralis]
MSHDRIASLSIEHFNRLPKMGKPSVNTEWTVLCCIVKENTLDDNFEVVSLGTGSKCIGKSKMSATGDVLNDSHAEVVCRRAFLCYVYEQINLGTSDVFTLELGECSLNSFIKFHFFTTHVPCGDAAIFPKQDATEFGTVVADEYVHDAKKPRLDDIYRTGAKSIPGGGQDSHLQGAEYHALGVVRTKPGRGDPTLSVSCSDKLAKWYHLGIQGALLSLLLVHPIYLSSFTIANGTPFDEKSLLRALYGRFGEDAERAVIGRSSINFSFAKDVSKRPCPASIVWFKCSTGSHEVAIEGLKQGVTKKNRHARSARLQICKIEMFRRFLTAAEFLRLPSCKNFVFYDDAKADAKDYQRKWAALKVDKFKSWTSKDGKLQHFVLD